MSLYILCRIHCLSSESDALIPALSKSMADLGIGFGLGGFESDEKTETPEGYSWPAGVEFHLRDDQVSTDATGLWNEAMMECRKILMNVQRIDATDLTFNSVASMSLQEEYFSSVAKTKLGSAIALIVDRFGIGGGLIVLSEGGIGTIEMHLPNICLDIIFRILLLPWDCIPNKAYAWVSSPQLP